MIRILLVDDHELVRDGLCRLLNDEHDIEVIGQAGTGHEAVSLAGKLTPDVILLDYNLPDIDGLETTEQIMSMKLPSRVLILTMYGNEEYAIRLVRSGASGFVVKGAPTDELLTAIRKVAARGTYVSPGIMEKMVGRMGLPSKDVPEAALSNREMQVLTRLARGSTTREVSEELNLSLSTVETYRSRILEKLNLRNNSDITRFAIRRNLIDLA